MSKKKPYYGIPLRCGLCQVEISGSWKDHEESEMHQNNLPKEREPVKIPEVPVREVSEAEQKQNIKECKIAKAENLGYASVSCGRSYYNLRCECGQISYVFAWRGCKRCPNCKKLLHLRLSFR